MAIYPLSSGVQEAYRTALNIPASPSMIDSETPVQPVSVIGGNFTIVNSFSKASQTQTPFIVSSNITSDTTTTLKTVTTGKTAYIKGIRVAGSSTTSGIALVTVLVATAQVHKEYLLESFSSTNNYSYTPYIQLDFDNRVTCPSGATIQVTTASGTYGSITATVWGHEE